MKKVYVLYKDYGWEGNSEPLGVVSTEEAAKAWVDAGPGWAGREYKELVVDGEVEETP